MRSEGATNASGVRILHVLPLGLVEYDQALELQRRLAQMRIRGEVDDLLLLLEHPPVITLGRGGKANHLLAEQGELRQRGIQFVEVERGGDITYHGPGQLVGYPILDLNLHGCDIHLYVRRLEEVLIRTLRNFGIDAERRVGLTGVWVGTQKIASIGVHIRRWVTWHGFSLNVDMDLSYFGLIVPCGIDGVAMTSMALLKGEEVPLPEVMERLAQCFAETFRLEPKSNSPGCRPVP